MFCDPNSPSTGLALDNADVLGQGNFLPTINERSHARHGHSLSCASALNAQEQLVCADKDAVSSAVGQVVVPGTLSGAARDGAAASCELHELRELGPVNDLRELLDREDWARRDGRRGRQAPKRSVAAVSSQNRQRQVPNHLQNLHHPSASCVVLQAVGWDRKSQLRRRVRSSRRDGDVELLGVDVAGTTS